MYVSATIEWFCYNFFPMNRSMPKPSITEWKGRKASIMNIYGNNLGNVNMKLRPELNVVQCWSEDF
jgi:hypothetical protein